MIGKDNTCSTCKHMKGRVHMCDRNKWSKIPCSCRENHSMERFYGIKK